MSKNKVTALLTVFLTFILFVILQPGDDPLALIRVASIVAGVVIVVIVVIVAIILALISNWNSTIGSVLLGIFSVYFVFFYNRAIGLLYGEA